MDMVNAIRSPGSVLKPFIYGMALDEGLIHPASLQDVPRRTGDYRPGNFDSGFHGPVSMSEALVRSLNLPAVQVLEAYGPKRFAGMLSNAGLAADSACGRAAESVADPGGRRKGWRISPRRTAPLPVTARRQAGRPGDPLVERAVVTGCGVDYSPDSGRRGAATAGWRAAAGGAAGVENRHQLRLS
jgi:penicillin-binding protein 1C